MDDGTGAVVTYELPANSLKMEDFLGITSLETNKDGCIVNMPEEFKAYSPLLM